MHKYEYLKILWCEVFRSFFISIYTTSSFLGCEVTAKSEKNVCYLALNRGSTQPHQMLIGLINILHFRTEFNKR